MNKLFLIGIFIWSSHLFGEAINSDELALENLNAQITAAEDRGDQKWLESVLASELAFRRANGVLVGRQQFLADVKSREPSKTTIESIKIYGDTRAVVTCVVTIKINGQDTEFHNIRLFIREGKSWKLLGWANERLSP
jgi:hypothetical protein